jgi:hypothetical protein
MNVALSRAKERIIVVGDKQTFAGRTHMHRLWSSLAQQYEKIDRLSTAQNQVCQYFILGECKYGDRCKFSHDSGYLYPSLPRTEDCAHWLMGVCQHGELCRFIHDPGKLGSFAGKADPGDCVFWLKGNCRRDDCTFEHNPGKQGLLAPSSAKNPFQSKDCFNWMNSICNRDDCPFRHDPSKKSFFAKSYEQQNLYKFYKQDLVSLLRQVDDPAALADLLRTHKLVEPNSGSWHQEPIFKSNGTKFRSILHVAARLGCHRIVDRLVTLYRCDIDYQDADGFTALMFAAWYAHTETVRVLLHHGAKKDLTSGYNETALEAARSAQMYWQKHPIFDLGTNSRIFPREQVDGGWATVDLRTRDQYPWTPDWSEIINLLNDAKTEHHVVLCGKIRDSKNLEEICQVVNSHPDDFDEETLVVAWQCILEEMQASNSKMQQLDDDAQKTLRSLEEATLHHAPQFDFKHLLRIVYSFAKHENRYQPQNVLKDKLVSSLENLPSNLGLNEMVNVLWAFATLKVVPEDRFFEKYFDILSRNDNIIQNLSPSTISKLSWALANFERIPAGLIQKVVARTKTMVPILSNTMVFDILWSFAKFSCLTNQEATDDVKKQLKSVSEKLLLRIEMMSTSFKKVLRRKIERTQWACQQLGFKFPVTMEEALQKILSSTETGAFGLEDEDDEDY